MILNQIPHFPKNNKNIIIITLCLRPIIKKQKQVLMSSNCTHQQSPDESSYLHGSRTLNSTQSEKNNLKTPADETLGEGNKS